MNISDVKGKRVKIIESCDMRIFEEKLNTFLQTTDRPVWNIQYQYGKSSGSIVYSALIIYG